MLLEKRIAEGDQLFRLHTHFLGNLLRVSTLHNFTDGIHYLFVGFFMVFGIGHATSPKICKYVKRLRLFLSVDFEGHKATTKIPLAPPLKKGDEIDAVS
jgi:hypothetical protein